MALIVLAAALAALTALYLFLVAPRMFHKPGWMLPYTSTGAGNIIFYAHRGLFDKKAGVPENSIDAFRRAADAGYGIELDVQLSKDGIPVVFHDASLKRMCGVDGNVWDYTLDELKSMRLAGSSATIPTFSEVLDEVGGRVPLIVEYKLDVPDTKVCELGNRLLEGYPGAYCIESFHPLALIWYKKNRPDVIRGQLSMDFQKAGKHRPSFRELAVTYLLTDYATRPDFIAYRHQDASNPSRRLARRLGAISVAWTVKSRKQYEKVKGKFDLFIFEGFLPK